MPRSANAVARTGAIVAIAIWAGGALSQEAAPPPNGAEMLRRSDALPREEGTPRRFGPGADPVATPERAGPGALARHAVSAEVPSNRPILAVIVLDTGGPRVDLDLPVSVAVDASLPDAAARAMAYRDAGHEVLHLPSIPPGATARDAAVALEAGRRAVPGAVGIFDPDAASPEGRADVAGRIVASLAESGAGLVTAAGGIGGVTALAEARGVPVIRTERRIAEGDGATALRELRRGAFAARQSGAAIVVGPNTPVFARLLEDWAAGLDLETLSLVPISVPLRRAIP